MKQIKLFMLVTFGFYIQQISAAQQSQDEMYAEQRAIIDDNVQRYSYLSDAFNFLQSQDFLHESFYDFLSNRLFYDEDGELDFDAVIDQAEDVLTANMKDVFIQTLETAMTDHKNLDQFNDPMFLYVMQHKDDFMHDMVNFWLYEWSKIKNGNGQAPLHRAAQYNNQEITSMLFAVGADFNLQDNNGWTPLHEATKDNSSEVVDMLLVAGVNINTQDKSGQTALHRATVYNNFKIAHMLIDIGADLNIKDNYHWTALHRAACYRYLEITRMLVDAGANLNLQDRYRLTPLCISIQYNCTEVSYILGSVEFLKKERI